MFGDCELRNPYHRVVFQFRLSQRWSVARNDDKLGLAGSQTLERRLVAEGDFAGLHHKRQARAVVIWLEFLGFKTLQELEYAYLMES